MQINPFDAFNKGVKHTNPHFLFILLSQKKSRNYVNFIIDIVLSVYLFFSQSNHLINKRNLCKTNKCARVLHI